VQGDEDARNGIGLLWDFTNLKKIIDELDHKSLNDILEFNPTVENLTLHIYRNLKKDYQSLRFKVRVYESIVKKEAFCETGDF
jgi:6-pyruvoyl-tetrahydropterin synthase